MEYLKTKDGPLPVRLRPDEVRAAWGELQESAAEADQLHGGERADAMRVVESGLAELATNYPYSVRVAEQDWQTQRINHPSAA